MNFWRETFASRYFLDYLCLSKQKKRFADLFTLTLLDFKADASRLLGDDYHFSPSLFIRMNYPEYTWTPWRFDRVSKVHLSPSLPLCTVYLFIYLLIFIELLEEL